MPKRKVTKQVAEKIFELRRQGVSDSEIGRQLDLDRRTVKAAADKVSKAADSHHWEAVLQRVDADVLRRHLQELLKLVDVIQRETSGDLIGISPSWGARDWIRSVAARAFDERWSESRSLGRGADGGRFPELADLGLRALGQHEPLLGDTLQKWMDTFDRFQVSRRSILREGGAALKQARFDDDVVSKTARLIQREVCERRLNGVEAGSCLVLESDTVGEADLLRRIPGVTEERFYHGERAIAEEFGTVYADVLEQLLCSRPLDTVHRTFRELARLRNHYGSMVNAMLFRGRPSGRCELCPNAVL